ncbi:MAG TPA: histidinol-phosphate transaminase [Candidatus Dormibacteraeota bacterium]|jgi:histidinol-phosphate aminotransferase
MSQLRRRSLGEQFGYVPGEQPPDGEGWIKLNTNESPLPPSPHVAAAIGGAAHELNRYPDPHGEPLRSALAAHHGVDPSSVAVGNGADGLIDSCIRAFCEPGARLVVTDPTYSLLPVAARIHGATPHPVALPPGGEVPDEFAAIDAPLRFIVNPNTPTGTWVDPAELESRLRDATGVVVIDEAYCDFAPRSCIPLLADHPTWLVLRTFSKAYALAGLRVGYAVGAADLIDDLNAVAESYPVDRCAIAGARAALDDVVHHRALVDAVVDERHRLTAALNELGWQLTPSHANFVAGRPVGETAAAVAQRLRQRRVLVRCLGTAQTAILRITVGSVAENDALLAALR